MYRSILCALALLVCLPAVAGDGGDRLARRAATGLLGRPAPGLVLRTIDGRTIDLAALYGHKAVYLKFWATWCTICRAQMPHFKQVFADAGPNLQVIAVDIGFDDTVAAVRAYRSKVGLRMPIVFDDGRLAEAFHLRVTPQSVVIGRDGRVLFVGHEADARLDAALRKAQRMPASAAVAAVPPPPLGRVEPGDRLPAFRIATLGGHMFRSMSAGPAARPTVLVFLSPWCESYLADSRPQLAQTCASVREQVHALAGDHRVRWLGIASGLWADAARLRRYRREYAVGIPLALDADGALFRRFGVMHVPTVLLVDARGKVVRRDEGGGVHLRRELAALLASPRSAFPKAHP